MVSQERPKHGLLPRLCHSLLDPTHETSLSSQLGQFLVVLQQLRSRLGDHDVVITFESVLGDRVMSRVWGEDWKSREKTCSRGISRSAARRGFADEDHLADTH